MITANDLFFLIERAEAPALTRMTKANVARLERIKAEAAKMKEVEDAEKCWLRRCNSPVTDHLRVGGYQLHLCSAHGDEMDQKAHEVRSYVNVAPPEGYSHWPWKLPTT